MADLKTIHNWLALAHEPGRDWQGQIGEEDGLAVFGAPEYALRAGLKRIRKLVAAGWNTPRLLVGRLAPPHVSTFGHVRAVANATALDVDRIPDWTDRGIVHTVLRGLILANLGHVPAGADDAIRAAFDLLDRQP